MNWIYVNIYGYLWIYARYMWIYARYMWIYARYMLFFTRYMRIYANTYILIRIYADICGYTPAYIYPRISAYIRYMQIYADI